MKDEPKISFDAALLMALHADAKQEISELPTQKELKERYLDTKRWDIRLKNALNRRKSIVWKRLLVSMAVGCMLFVSTLAVNADFRNAVYMMIRTTTPNELQITYQVEGETLDKLPEEYREHYIISGYELDKNQEYQTESSFIRLYRNKYDSSIFYIVDCFAIGKYGQKMQLDNEHTEYKNIKIKDADGVLGESTNEVGKAVYYLIWEKDGINHLIEGVADLSELMLVAESIY